MLVEKPLATTSADARDLIEVAEARGLVLMPGHTFLYSPPVNKVRELIAEDVLGEVYFVTSSRMNLGKYQPDGVICDLAPHDLSILLYWLDEPVVEVAAIGRSVFQADVPETAFITLTFEGGADGQRPDLVARAAQGPRDDRRRQPAHGPVRRHAPPTRRCASTTAAWTFAHPTDVRRAPAHLPQRRHRRCRGSRRRSRSASSWRTSRARSGPASAPRSHAELGLEIVLAMEAAEASLRRNGQPVAVTRPTSRVAA